MHHEHIAWLDIHGLDDTLIGSKTIILVYRYPKGYVLLYETKKFENMKHYHTHLQCSAFSGSFCPSYTACSQLQACYFS